MIAKEATACADCAYWEKVREVDGHCRRFAPEAARLAEEVSHWPLTHARQGCGDGETAACATPRVTCAVCIYWRRYKGGLHPMNRSDMPNNWWARAGVCIRRAPKPAAEPGPRAFWRATADIDFCGEGVAREVESGG
jgi:hypothetical protein